MRKHGSCALLIIILDQHLQYIALRGLLSERNVLSQPVIELKGQRWRRRFFLALFSHLRGCFRTSPALSQCSKGWHTAGGGEDALPEFRPCKCELSRNSLSSERSLNPKSCLLLPLSCCPCDGFAVQGFPPHMHTC